MLRITITALFICSIISLSYAQDTIKKTNPVKANPNAKANQYHAYKYHTRADSAELKRRIQDSLHLHTYSSATPVSIDRSLNGQYQYVLNRVYHYQEPLISALWKNASDTLVANRAKLKAAQSMVKAKDKVIDSLNTELNNNDSALNARIDSVSLFGIVLSKTGYNLTMWGLVAILGVIIFIIIGRSGNYRREAKYRIQLFNELEDEFKNYKTKANDKEKKLARELQTERNKLDELLGRG
jgi:hypothetical protein